MRAADLLTRCSPAVPRRALFFVAAGVWLAAGALLLLRGSRALDDNAAAGAAALGAGLLFFRLLFVRIADRTVTRIRTLAPEHPCVFSFTGWRGYGAMLVMISGGLTLRSSGFLPPPLPGVLFVTMGTPLLLSSLRLLRAGLSPPRL